METSKKHNDIIIIRKSNSADGILGGGVQI